MQKGQHIVRSVKFVQMNRLLLQLRHRFVIDFIWIKKNFREIRFANDQWEPLIRNTKQHCPWNRRRKAHTTWSEVKIGSDLSFVAYLHFADAVGRWWWWWRLSCWGDVVGGGWKSAKRTCQQRLQTTISWRVSAVYVCLCQSISLTRWEISCKIRGDCAFAPPSLHHVFPERVVIPIAIARRKVNQTAWCC